MGNGQTVIGVAQADRVSNIGGVINPNYGERQPMTYPVMDQEFEVLSNYSRFSGICYGVGSFLLSCFVSASLNFAFASTPRTDVATAIFYGSWLLFLLSGSAFVVGWNFDNKRSSLEQQIRDQTVFRSTSPASLPTT